VGAIVADPRFAELTPEVRTKILSNAVEQAREQASGRLFAELGVGELNRRMREKQPVGAGR
jgi:hypothetical protein